MSDRILGVSSELATSQVTVGTTATQLAAYRAGRKSLTITQVGSTAVYYGPKVQPPGNSNAGQALSTSNGGLLPAVANTGLTLFPFNGELWAIVATGTEVVTVTEIF